MLPGNPGLSRDRRGYLQITTSEAGGLFRQILGQKEPKVYL